MTWRRVWHGLLAMTVTQDVVALGICTRTFFGPDAGAVFSLRPSHSLSTCQISSAVFTFAMDLPPFSTFSSLYSSTIMEGIFSPL